MKKIAILLMVCLLVFGAAGTAEETDYIFAQPGDSGGDVEILLLKCAELGFIKELPEGTDEYPEEYRETIQNMEKALGLTEDGVIWLSEFEELETAVGVGTESPQVKDMLERLFELGYIREVLPEPHTVYEKKYEAAVKKAEKALELQADGILTASEQSAIKNKCRTLPQLDQVKTCSARYGSGKVTVSWGAVKGAVSYTVYRNGMMLQTVNGKTSFVDTDAHMGDYLEYYVKAKSYLRSGPISKTASVEVPITYKSATLKDLHNSGDQYLTQDTQHVKLGTMKFLSGTVSGVDFKIEVSQKIGSSTYYATLVLDDYKTWTGSVPNINSEKNRISSISGNGYVISSGSHPVLIMNHISYNYK
jgi:hypothetical protein